MSQLKTGELETYVRRIGENIINVYAKLNELSKNMEKIEGRLEETNTDLANNMKVVSEFKETSVQKEEFDYFVNRLTESLKDLIPPIPVDTEEDNKENQSIGQSQEY